MYEDVGDTVANFVCGIILGLMLNAIVATIFCLFAPNTVTNVVRDEVIIPKFAEVTHEGLTLYINKDVTKHYTDYTTVNDWTKGKLELHRIETIEDDKFGPNEEYTEYQLILKISK
jgi:hypothetical protein